MGRVQQSIDKRDSDNDNDNDNNTKIQVVTTSHDECCH